MPEGFVRSEIGPLKEFIVNLLGTFSGTRPVGKVADKVEDFVTLERRIKDDVFQSAMDDLFDQVMNDKADKLRRALQNHPLGQIDPKHLDILFEDMMRQEVDEFALNPANMEKLAEVAGHISDRALKEFRKTDRLRMLNQAAKSTSGPVGEIGIGSPDELRGFLERLAQRGVSSTLRQDAAMKGGSIILADEER